MKLRINYDQISILNTKYALFTTLSRSFTRMYLKITPTNFHVYLRGDNGVFETILTLDNLDNFVDTKYLYVDYLQWRTVLLKFRAEQGLNLTVTSNSLKIQEEGSPNSVSLGISFCRSNSSDVAVIDNFIPTKREEIQQAGLHLVLTEELINDFVLANSLFVVQGHTNSIGLASSDVMYADRSVVLKMNLENPVEEEFFENLTGDSHVYLHSSFLELFNHIFEYDPNVHFSSDYDLIFWTDNVSSIIMASPEHEIALPDDDDWEEIRPKDPNSYFVTKVSTVNSDLDFFVGFYESSQWKPLTFNVSQQNGVTMVYKHPTAEVKKELEVSACTADGSFKIDSETLKRLVVIGSLES